MFPEGDYLWLPGRLAAKIHRREGRFEGLSPPPETPFFDEDRQVSAFGSPFKEQAGQRGYRKGQGIGPSHMRNRLGANA